MRILSINRHYYNSSVNNRDRNGDIGTSVCDKCTSWSSFLPNPSYGSHGSAWWYMEITRQRCLCTQTSEFEVLPQENWKPFS